MIKEAFNEFIENWQREKTIAVNELNENKVFNAGLKAMGINGKEYEKQKKKYSLYELSSANIINNKLPDLIYSNCGLLKSKYKIQGSIGQGNPAEIPWLCIFDNEITTSAQTGYYIVFLFEANLKGVYMSLNQGWTQYEEEYGVAEGKNQILKNSSIAKSLLRSDQGFTYLPINLNATSTLGKGYEAGNICSKFYSSNDFPEDNVLIDDLRNLIGVYRELKGLVGTNIKVIKGKISEEEFQSEIQKVSRKEIKAGAITKRDKKESTSSSSWIRDPNIAYTALDNASFTCENSKEHVTFVSSKTGHQFVEAHHLIPMEFQDAFTFSIDVPENIISLCPNCHRAFHNSVDEIKLELVSKFYKQRCDLLLQRGIYIEYEELTECYIKENNSSLKA